MGEKLKGLWPQLTIVVLLLAVLVVPVAVRSDHAAAAGEEAAGSLVIYSPHNEQIRFEFSRAFNDWRVRQGLAPVAFDWRSSGGTSDLRRQVLAEFEQKGQLGRFEGGIGADLFFGGGEYEHNKLAQGVEVPSAGGVERRSVTRPVELPEGMLEEAFPEATIGGERLYHPELYWVGAALSSFGIVYNRDLLEMLRLPEPRTWSDLAAPGFDGWVALADPGHSGSIAAAYNAILRRKGWGAGWRLLREVFANARYFTSSATRVPVDVSSGEAAAGMCIDFYGRYQAGAVGGRRVGYVDPAYMTAITADPISILRGAPHAEVANQFVVWLLSTEGQQLWQGRVGTAAGPLRYELRRLPVRRDMYRPAFMERWTDEVDPFEIARPFPEGMPDFFGTVAPISHAMAIDVHEDLLAAWDAIERHPDHPHRERMVELLHRMPEALSIDWPDEDLRRHWVRYLETPGHPRHDEAAKVVQGFIQGLMARWSEGDQLLRDRVQWSRFFRSNYRQVVALADRQP